MAKKTKSKKAQPTVSTVLGAMNRIAPPHLAESWDNVGLQTGNPEAPAGRILVALEVTSDVLAEAEKLKARTLVTHHPLIFRPMKSLAETGVIPSLVTRLVRSQVALIASHTNLDSVGHGTNGELADRLGLQTAGRAFLRPAPPEADTVKVTVHVPLESFSAVFKAMTKAGAGRFEHYEQSTFRTLGTSTFKPLPGSNPTRGKTGELSQVEEVRLEAACTRKKLPAVLQAIRASHPYEEPVFDIATTESAAPPIAGLGMVGTLKKPEKISNIIRRAKKSLGVKSVGLVGDAGKAVRKIALCTGAGGEFVRNWRTGTADLFVTGEMSHHDCHEAHERDLPVLLLGHWASEAIVCGRLADILGQTLADMGFPEAEIVASKAQRDPLRRV